MRNLILLCCLCCTARAYAGDSTLHRWRVQMSYVYAVPTGGFAHNGQFLLGQVKPTSGVSFLFSAMVTDHISAGIHFSDVIYPLSSGKIFDQIAATNRDPQYYNTIYVDATPKYEIGSAGISGSYSFYTPFMEIEPYIIIGAGFGNAQSSVAGMTVHRKKKNDNYAEDIRYTISNSTSFFYPGIGLHLNKKISGIWYANLGVQYNYGNMDYTVQAFKYDFLNNYSVTNSEYTIPVSSFNIEAGMQLRFRKMHKYRPHKAR